ncbi:MULTISPECIES: NACHT domain-containing protein [unclassified Curtobacterium]|uniref:NACHT domain-containing protein n=1 Tax=unclassified Curtobacterium TaxID=257496 RepID=UPI0010D34A87|nr:MULTISPECIES: NACHT domain-containing protein [unclassified Curtobacterium]TCL79658.1 NACHT domain-containing protein [Curtobacterium sp. PhB128]TCL98168.1 NACHT domain-containing protein [Curtobacterium sp. PhB138]
MAKLESQDDEQLFEAEVLRVARALWVPNRPFQGSVILDGAERDGIFVGDDIVAVVEATVSKRLDKAKKDGDKLKQASERLSKSHPLKAIKGYFVTRDEPTAEQRQYINSLRSGVVACSFAQLRSLLINSREYLNVRQAYAFGSARNLDTGAPKDLDVYVPIGLLEESTSGRARVHSVADIANRMSSGGTTVLLGDFGAGKSMTIREVHSRLASSHLKNPEKRFPVTLNLRDHQGQKAPDEALRRHCQAIGFEEGTKLVRAWRAGQVDILLDGFDEIATTGWLSQAVSLRQIRRNSVELIRNFTDQTPDGAGIFLTGRRHLFDSNTELSGALGISSRNPLVLSTDDFSEAQVTEYLTARGWDGSLPGWLPPRPPTTRLPVNFRSHRANH